MRTTAKAASISARWDRHGVDWPLTISVLIFGILYTYLWLFSVVTMPNCRLAYNWVSGWHSHTSLFHMTGYIIAGLLVWWGISNLKIRNWTTAVIALFQLLILLTSLWVQFAMKSIIMPYGSPGLAQMKATIPWFMRADLVEIMEGGYQSEEISYADWPYRFPPPPTLPPGPLDSKDTNPKYFQIFRGTLPKPVEIEAARTCAIAYDEAEEAFWIALDARRAWFQAYYFRVSEEDRKHYRINYY